MISSPLQEKGERHVALHGNPGRSSDMPKEILQLFSSLQLTPLCYRGFKAAAFDDDADDFTPAIRRRSPTSDTDTHPLPSWRR